MFSVRWVNLDGTASRFRGLASQLRMRGILRTAILRAAEVLARALRSRASRPDSRATLT